MSTSIQRSASAAVALALILAAMFALAPSANADAESGVCSAGRTLESYTYSEPAYDSGGEKMWQITWKKRWCYDLGDKAVTSWYSPTPSISIYSYFDLAWRVGDITSDAYYTSVGADGRDHPNYPRWGHKNVWRVDMQHCAVRWALCTHHYWRVGTIGYWDGSKKIIDYEE